HWKDRGYTDILDIGCAEGFYAVGMARLWPVATVHAYDIEPAALELCRQLARTNGVSERVRVEGACTADTLRQFPFRGRALILSDCEGYEAQLFTAETMPALAKADIVIEVHEQAGLGFLEKVEALAAATHRATRIRTQPRQAGESIFLSKFSDFDQVLILSEARDGVLGHKPQWWLVLESRA
ncbi:class I SAM-dependent methyltransferase, partial [Nostoc sp. NIES-2111]